jgi:hypothetical protein
MQLTGLLLKLFVYSCKLPKERSITAETRLLTLSFLTPRLVCFSALFFSNCTPVIGHKQFADHELPTELSITQTAALVPGRLDVCVHLDAHACSTLSAWIHAPPALASFPALASEPPAFSFTSVAHATRMTHPRLFQTGAAPVSSRPPRSSPPPLPQQHRAACASSTGQCPRLGPARPHGHQRRRSALAT